MRTTSETSSETTCISSVYKKATGELRAFMSADDAQHSHSLSHSLSHRHALDHETLWRYMRQLLERVARVFEREDSVIDECLDTVVDLLGADRGAVLLTSPDGTAHVINARAAGRALSPTEREEISRTIVRECLESGECIVRDHRMMKPSSRGPGAAAASLVSFGIHAALAAPLSSASKRDDDLRPVLYVDFRRLDSIVEMETAHVEFFMAAVVLFSAVIEQNRLGKVTREQLAEVKQSRFVEARQTPPLAELLAPSSMTYIREELESALHGASSILILGESGSGKTLLAQAISEASGRRPIVRVVLGGSDDLNSITSELFGHEKGSYTGAAQKRTGMVELADGGTLILDEILNLAPQAQKLLLDFTQFGTYRPLGYARAEPKKADVRIIAATNGDIDAARRDGRFREDLYHRLAAVRLELPSLRDRRADLAALAERVLARGSDPSSSSSSRAPWTLSPDLRRVLVGGTVEWSGNVRELEAAVLRGRERALAKDPNCTELRPEHMRLSALPSASTSSSSPSSGQAQDSSRPLRARWKDLETQIIDERLKLANEALAKHGDNAAAAADELGIPRTTLRSFLQAQRAKQRG
jgi:DNA-binding NtrC family response regulator